MVGEGPRAANAVGVVAAFAHGGEQVAAAGVAVGVVGRFARIAIDEARLAELDAIDTERLEQRLGYVLLIGQAGAHLDDAPEHVVADVGVGIVVKLGAVAPRIDGAGLPAGVAAGVVAAEGRIVEAQSGVETDHVDGGRRRRVVERQTL
jgi:hypothetical protein